MTPSPWALRVGHLGIVVILAFSLLAGRLWQLQAIEGSRYLELSEQNRIRDYVVPAPRGVIFDRRGQPLVTNRASFTVALLPMEVRDPPRVAAALARVLDVDAAEILARLAEGRKRPFEPVRLRRDADRRVVVAIEENRLDLPGVVIQAEPVREYLHGALAAHALGYLGEITEAELRTRPGYRPGDLIGKTGVERTYDDLLRGEAGRLRVEVDAAGRPGRVLGRQTARPGHSLVLNLDAVLQRVAEEQLRGQVGAVVAMDPRTGEVLALASSPTYDPAVFAGGISPANWRRLTSDRGLPLLNRAAEGVYEPGSVFKVVTGTAALAEGVARRESTYACTGALVLGRWVFRDLAAYGTVSFVRGVQVSCNVMFWTLGRAVGPERLTRYATALGLGAPTDIDLPAEAAGFIPSVEWKPRAHGEPWYPGDTLNMSIGQGWVLTTPLQIARMLSAIANGGTLVQPVLARRVVSPDGREVRAIAGRRTPVPERLPAAALETLREGLRLVVDAGTGRAAAVDGLAIAGKTGSAENPRGRPHAWFAGYAPADRPSLVVVAFVEHGYRGGIAAAPIARAVFEAARPALLAETGGRP
ncbi:MAG: penicillin-binding protein 2 [Armatimonadota bacterium]|nr:penicillin-binding protein 2 [Armatimonadota bacterium]MDR7422933.1 penicillin-binding protein 2 [Armatimonadota bacterium]MDR7454685.1 penicillin-binding protein 2 [Armatimonadota bacterium]MDR7456320.1 penicillin-binding protein 2 [Armatimonadota bacterium]MDR7496317.1 penicillin-binding protein 2 [Armatimonadota bacterium]